MVNAEAVHESWAVSPSHAEAQLPLSIRQPQGKKTFTMDKPYPWTKQKIPKQETIGLLLMKHIVMVIRDI